MSELAADTIPWALRAAAQAERQPGALSVTGRRQVGELQEVSQSLLSALLAGAAGGGLGGASSAAGWLRNDSVLAALLGNLTATSQRAVVAMSSAHDLSRLAQLTKRDELGKLTGASKAGDDDAPRAVCALLDFLLGAARSKHLAPMLVGVVAQLTRDPLLQALKHEAERTYAEPGLAEWRHLRGYTCFEMARPQASLFVECWHEALKLMSALLSTTEGDEAAHEAAVVSALGFLRHYLPLFVAPLDCSVGGLPRCTVAQLTDAAAVLDFLAALSKDDAMWRAREPAVLDHLLALTYRSVGGWVLLLGRSPLPEEKEGANLDKDQVHAEVVRDCCVLVSRDFDGVREGTAKTWNKVAQAMKTVAKAAMLPKDRAASAAAAAAKAESDKRAGFGIRGFLDEKPKPVVPLQAVNPNVALVTRHADTCEEDDDQFGGETGSAASGKLSFLHRLEFELLGALAPALLLIKRTSPLAPPSHGPAMPRWMVPLGGLARPPVVPAGTFVHLQGDVVGRWCVRSVLPHIDEVGRCS